MKYETPELVQLTPAINAVQGGSSKNPMIYFETPLTHEAVPAYADWE
jgi:hypothetical protein